MSKKNYIVIAAAIKNLSESISKNGQPPLKHFVRNLAEEFKTDNPLFDNARFFEACGFKYQA